MGYRVVWTPTAAIKLGETIIQKSLLLAEHPRLGRVLRKLHNDSLREIPVSPYRLIHELDDQTSVAYVRVLWHGTRQEPDLR